MFRKSGRNSEKGQNTAEYLIMLTLVAVGSIGLVTVFGNSIQNKFAQMTAAIGGDTANYTTATTAQSVIANTAGTRVTTGVQMKGQDVSEFSSVSSK